MTHFGILQTLTGKWMVDQLGIVFWTTSKAVAEAQLEQMLGDKTFFQVSPFLDEG